MKKSSSDKHAKKAKKPSTSGQHHHHGAGLGHKKQAKPKKPVHHHKQAKAKKAKKTKPLVHHSLSLTGRTAPLEVAPAVPLFVDLSTDPDMPPVVDQGEGSCIAHASVGMFTWATRKGFDPTRITSLEVAGLQSYLNAGTPVVAGLIVCESFVSEQAMATGVVSMSRRERVVAAHYLMVVGIGDGSEWQAHGFPAADPGTRYIKARNTWGTDVYREGYVLLPMDYLATHVTELWTLGSRDTSHD